MSGVLMHWCPDRSIPEATTGDAMAAADERQIRQRLAAGDETVLGDVYDRFAPLVYGLALRVTRSREAAEDVTQEVFVFLWERPLAFDPERGGLRGWLRTLAHRRAVEYVRREERLSRHLATYRWSPAIPGADEHVIAVDERGQVRLAVAALPGTLREVIELAYYRGRTYRQVAAELGLAEGTAKSRIRVGLRRIAATLQEQEEGVSS
jgi:RNA polymerase sigma factor (sigma-70 family)